LIFINKVYCDYEIRSLGIRKRLSHANVRVEPQPNLPFSILASAIKDIPVAMKFRLASPPFLISAMGSIFLGRVEQMPDLIAVIVDLKVG
jgi:hypothetical protein